VGKKQDRSILLPSLSIESIDASDRYAPVAHENIHELLLIFGASWTKDEVPPYLFRFSKMRGINPCFRQ
jgi:hypothetical protein